MTSRTARTLVAAAACALALPVPAAAAAGAGAASGITHVWQIELENESSSSTYPACTSPANNTAIPDHYLDCELRPTGMFLSNYHATGHVSLDNYLAQVAGVPYNATTAADCGARYFDVTGSADNGGAGTGVGCVYPATPSTPSVTTTGLTQATTITLADQLQQAHKSWQGLMEDMGWDPTREQSACGIALSAGKPLDPAANQATAPSDGTNTAEHDDQYAARHNPFPWFHSLLDSGACAAHVVPLGTRAAPLAGLTANLQDPPNFTFITPDLCSDGHDGGTATSKCVGPDLGQEIDDPTAQTDGTVGLGGLASADSFLQKVVPAIQASPAYQAGTGMIVITTDEGAASDTAACCGETTTGGGITGALLLSKALTPGTSTVAYNHFSLLRSYEDLFGITSGGADGAGHLLEAATATSFGPDVLGGPVASTPEVPLPVLGALPLAGVGYLAWRRNRRR